MVLIAMARQRLGANSEISVMALGIAAPKPRPVRNRHSVRVFRVFAPCGAQVARPKNKHEKTSTRLAHPVRYRTCDQRTQRQSQQRGTQYRPQILFVDPHSAECRGNAAHCRCIETIDCQHQKAQHNE